jgi:hypothetical protein
MRRTTALTVFLSLCWFTPAARADTITLTPFLTGVYAQNTHDGTVAYSPGGYIVGYVGTQTGPFQGIEWRNFFAFDLSAVTGEIVGATLRLTGGQSDQLPFSNGLGLPFLLHDVTTPMDQLLGGTSPSRNAVFDDLGSGLFYGAGLATIAHNRASSPPVEVNFTADGLTALNMSAGHQFAFGGSTLVPPDVRTDYFGEIFAFDYVFHDFTRELVISTVPEPTSLLMMASGLVTLFGYRRSYRRKG